MEGKKNSTLLKRILFGLMMLALVFPMLQHKFKWLKETPLNGAFELLERPVFSYEAWFEGTYQDQRTDYLNQNVGFRNNMVRTYNQWHFSFYKQANANGVVIGKDNYLYEENYIKAHRGLDFRGEEVIQEQVERLAKVSDTLQKLGKHLVVLLAPGKASFYPEYIPGFWIQKRGPLTNLSRYSAKLKEQVIPTMNLNSWFIKNKGKMPHPLYPKTGIHWSKYGEIVMADTLIKFFNKMPGVHLPQLIVDSVKRKTEMWDTDDDIEKGMNLLFNIPDNEMGYPYFRVVKNPEKKYSKVLTVADSYFWGPFNGGMSRDLFNDGRFWYYNETIFPDSYESLLNVSDVDFQKELEENDVILIICTDANLFKFGFGFIEQAYDTYFPKK